MLIILKNFLFFDFIVVRASYYLFFLLFNNRQLSIENLDFLKRFMLAVRYRKTKNYLLHYTRYLKKHKKHEFQT